MDRHPSEMISRTFSVADFQWERGYLVTRRGNFQVKINSTKESFKFSPMTEGIRSPNYANYVAIFISEIYNECFLSGSEIYIRHNTTSKKAHVIIEHADLGHTSFNLFIKVFNGDGSNIPQVELLNRTRFQFLSPDFQYIEDICEQYNTHMDDPAVNDVISRFDRDFPNYTKIERIKKLDFIFWSLREFRMHSLLEYDSK